MNIKKVVVVTTGGTIAMRYDSVTNGLVPAVNGKELMDAVPQLKEFCEVEIYEFSNIPSPNMTPTIMKDLADKVDEILMKDDTTGVVITHGTDTVEETAYFLDLYLKSDKPVALTAAMRGAGDLSPDGPKNILSAVKAVTADDAYGKGVMVVLNDEIHAAREVTKTHTASVATFASPFWGAIGYVEPDRVIFRRESINRMKIRPDKIVDNVYLIKAFTGMNTDIFDFLISKKVKGVVIEGFGRGNLPANITDGIKLMIDTGIIVVLSTRVLGGRVLDVYSYPGAVKPVKEMGVILAGELNGQKARIKLILALGKTDSKVEIERYFDNP